MADLVIVAHKGAPCFPPIVEGVLFESLGEDDLFVAEVSEAQAAHFTRNDAFFLFEDGKKDDAAAIAAAAAKAEAEKQAAPSGNGKK